MKTKKFLPMILAVAVIALFTTSCKKDDVNSNSTTDLGSIVGVWVTDKDNSGAYETYTFNSDGTGVLSDDNGSTNFEYTYSANKETLLLMFKGSDKGMQYSVQRTGNIMTLSTDYTYIKLTKK